MKQQIHGKLINEFNLRGTPLKTIGGGVGVVDFVDDDVVEALGGDAREVVGAGEFLDGADYHGSVGLHEVARAPAHLCGLARGHEERRKVRWA